MTGPYHASHLHSGYDVSQSLDPRTRDFFDQYKPVLPVMSTSTGHWSDKNITTSQLLSSAIENILKEPLSLTRVATTCSQTIGTADCRVISFGSLDADAMFIGALKAETNGEVRLQQKATTGASDSASKGRKSKLAIVGMAGRFPDSADHEKFWDLLEAGLDVHRKVRVFSPPSA